ncbi:MAG: hypothetical protein Fues2KO_42220 [Fuerstiella sp.]
MTEFQDTHDLARLESHCWTVLRHAISDRDHGWRLPVLATIAEQGCQQRTVVLRDVQPEQRRFAFHTDIRSAKIEQIRTQPKLSVLFYDTDSRAQLSVFATGRIHQDDELADRIWQDESESSLKTYLAPDRPGKAKEQRDPNLPSQFVDELPTRSQLESVRPNFAVISCEVQSLDLLLLRSDGHIRCQFQYTDSQLARARWVTP